MPEISIDVGELRKRKILVTTPMYGGMCGGQYTKSTADLVKLAGHYQMTIDFFYLFNESLITRARNYCVDEFLRNEQYTHLMFIDSDIGFNPNDVLSLAAIADPESDKDIICAPYPKKTISWEKIKLAVDKGFAEVLDAATGFMLIKRECLIKMKEAYQDLKYVSDQILNGKEFNSENTYLFFDTMKDEDGRYLSEDYAFSRRWQKIGGKMEI